jgi:hypothetical protein
MADMFWPLCTQGINTEESGVKGAGRGAAAQTGRNLHRKNTVIYSQLSLS